MTGIEDIPVPDLMRTLPRDERGYPVPWFVATIDGKPDLRIADSKKWYRCVRETRCWICGWELRGERVFVVGPVSSITRCTAEPPCHAGCAEYAAQVCPFLNGRSAKRRSSGLPDGTVMPGGLAYEHNPNCTALLDCRDCHVSLEPDGKEGYLFRIKGINSIKWFSSGRAANRSEVIKAMGFSKEICLTHVRSKRERKTLDAEFRRAWAYLPE